MRRLFLAPSIFAAAVLALATPTPTLDSARLPAQAYLPFVARQKPPTPTATPSQDAPPFIVIVAPAEANVGDEVILDASGTWDIDGDPIQFQWAQFHNPDRYVGTEYVTGHDAVLETLDGSRNAAYPDSLSDVAQTRFVPDWPGNYRFELVAMDDDGETQQFVDVVVHKRADNFEIRAVQVFLRAYDESMSVASEIFDRFATDGANYVALLPLLEMATGTSSEVYLCPERWSPSGCRTVSDEQLVYLIRLAHDKGLHVCLRPMLLVAEQGQRVQEIEPADVDGWFRSYGEHLMRYAEMAEANHVEILGIANELDSMEPYVQHWHDLIADVRSVYHGLLTYSDTGLMTGKTPAPFFSELDLLGLPFYYPGSGELHRPETGDTHPSVEEMTESFVRCIAQVLLPQVDRFAIPVVVTEMLLANGDGANFTPFNLHGPYVDRDDQEQIDYFEAAFRVWSSLPFVRGGIVSNIDLSYQRNYYHTQPPLELTDSFWDRPLEDAISLNFGQ